MPLYPVLRRSLLALRGANREGGAIPRRRKRGGREEGPFPASAARYTKLQLVQFPNEKHLFPRPPPPTPQNDKVPLLEKSEGREGLLAQERDRKPGKMEAVSLAAAEGLIRRGRDTLPTPPQVHYPLSFLHIPPFTGLVIWSPLVKKQKSLLFPAISWAPIVPFIPGDCTKIPSFLKMPFPINFFSLFFNLAVQPESVEIVLPSPPSSSTNSYGGEAEQDHQQHRKHLSAGRTYQVRCRVRGARPNNPVVTWWLGGRQVSAYNYIPKDHIVIMGRCDSNAAV